MANSVLSDRPSVAEAVEALFGAGTTLRGGTRVSGGDINRAFRLELSDGRVLFMKENDGRLRDMFRREAEGLLALAAADGPLVPRPLAYYCEGPSQYLLLEWLDAGARGREFWEEFGRAMARLHGASAERFGFTDDNYIGSTVQPNPWTGTWREFFGQHRLGFQVELAARAGRADRAMVSGVQRIIGRLEYLIDEPAQPALLHGDLWSGNFMVAAGGVPAIIDPAVYYGHPEADLAMTEMFGRFDQRFYDAYWEVRPSPGGYEDRREIYNLYHALNHLNLFGGGYRGAVMGVVRRYG